VAQRCPRRPDIRLSSVRQNHIVTAGRDSLLGWLKHAAAEPIAARSVPGASASERRQLGALGGLVRDLVPASDRNGWPSDVVKWIESGPVVPGQVVAAARSAITDCPDESLASLYGQLVSGANRRALGTFFTPSPEVELMLDMWERSEEVPCTVVDVGAGVGVFTVSAAQRWPKAYIFGVDINPVTLGLLALRTWLSGLPSADKSEPSMRIRLVRDDFTTWITKLRHEAEGPRLILGNPPYTRWQLLTAKDRLRLSEAASGLCGSRASLSTLMTSITLRHLDRSDGLCFLLPGQWLESQYAIPLRDYLARLTYRRIELRLVESKLFPDAQVDATVLLVGRERDSEQAFRIATWTAEATSSVDRTKLVGTQWRAMFSSTQPRRLTPVAAPNDSGRDSRLSDFCTVRRGTATGANGFFVLSDREAAEKRLPRTRLLKLVRRLRGYPDIIDDDVFESASSDEKRWLLNVARSHRKLGNAVDRYLTSGELASIPTRYLCRVRKSDWYELTHDLFIPDVIMSPMTRGQVRFVENAAGAAIINNLYGWRWHPEVSLASREEVLRWLRSEAGQSNILFAARRQGEGLRKIEPNALANMVVPASVARFPYTQPSSNWSTPAEPEI
jgi:hypothetical protein